MTHHNCVIPVTEVTSRRGVTTLVVEDGILADLCICKDYQFGVFVSIPIDADRCSEIVVSDGTVELPVYTKNCRYWRPEFFPCNSIICATYLRTPDLLKLNEVRKVRC